MGLGLLAWDRLPVWARRWRLISSGARKRRLQLTRGFFFEREGNGERYLFLACSRA